MAKLFFSFFGRIQLKGAELNPKNKCLLICTELLAL
jgi:hypothetical protein